MEINKKITVDETNVLKDQFLKKSLVGLDAATVEQYQEKASDIYALEKKVADAMRENSDIVADLQSKLEQAQKEISSYRADVGADVQSKTEAKVADEQKDVLREIEHLSLLPCLLLAFSDGYAKRSEQLHRGVLAKGEVMDMLDAVVVQQVLDNKQRKEVGDLPSLKENEALVLMTQQNNERQIHTFYSNAEAEAFLKGDSFKSLVANTVDEASVSPTERTVSYCLCTFDGADNLKVMVDNHLSSDGVSFTNEQLQALSSEILSDSHTTVVGRVGNPDHLRGDENREVVQQKAEVETVKLLGSEIFTEKEMLSKLSGYGIQRGDLSPDELKQLSYGAKSSLRRLSINTADAEISEMTCKFRFVRASDGTAKLMFHPVNERLDLSMTHIKGYELTKEDKRNLEVSGTIGKTVELTAQDGRKVPCIIGVDRETREVIALNTSQIKLPDTILGVKLDQGERDLLKWGRPLFKSGMNDKNGHKVDGWLMIQPGSKSLVIQRNKPDLQREKTLEKQRKI